MQEEPSKEISNKDTMKTCWCLWSKFWGYLLATCILKPTFQPSWFAHPPQPTQVHKVPTAILLIWQQLSFQPSLSPVQNVLASTRAHARLKNIFWWASWDSLPFPLNTLSLSPSHFLWTGGSTVKCWHLWYIRLLELQMEESQLKLD
jgi:hypothetical protein